MLFILWPPGLSQGYEDPRWMTYKQAAENGWQVRKGEKGTHIEFWEVKAKPEEKNGEPSKNGGDESAKENQRRLIHRVYTVFNAKQIEGVPAFERRQPSEFEAVQVVSASSPIPARKSRTTSATARSIVRPQTASTCLRKKPSKTRLVTTARRFTNSHTGPVTPRGSIARRLNESYRFGDLNYAKEELRAELASVFIAAEVGVPHDPAHHAAYVGSWIKALKEDKNEIFRAAHDASAATDLCAEFGARSFQGGGSGGRQSLP